MIRSAASKTMVENRRRTLSFVLALLVVVLIGMVPGARPAHAATLTVNSTGDAEDNAAGNGSCFTGGFIQVGPGFAQECTLRAAIQEANTTTAADTINFNIGGSGVKTISPASSLPVITQPLTIDGYTQPGASENTLAKGDDAVLLIRLDGSDAGFAAGLNITANDSVVRGLSVTGFSSSAGLVISGADNTRIEGNFVGTSPAGTRDLGNGWGVFLQSHFADLTNKPSNNIIGGTSPEDRNLISGNSTGVEITSGGGNKVQGNYIGTIKSGTGGLPNSAQGVRVSNGASGNLIGDNDLSDGPTNAANIIAFNVMGVDVSGDNSKGNTILRNSIFSNTGLGIDLGLNGVTPNDGPGDADTGPNNLQNYPDIASAKTGLRATTVKGTLGSAPSNSFTIWFYKNPESTKEEGKTFIGFKNVTDTDGDGIMPFTFKPPKKVKVGQFVTALVTNDTGDTSEFSVPKKVRE